MLFTLLKFKFLQKNWKYLYQSPKVFAAQTEDFMLHETRLHTPKIVFAKQTSFRPTLMTLTHKFVEINNLVDCAK